MAVSKDQVATRRRALGRRLSKQAGDIRIIAAEFRNTQDSDFLDAKEGKSLATQLDALDKIAANFDRLRQRLDTP